MPMRWLIEAPHWTNEAGSLVLEAPARTDWFIDPAGVSAPVLTGPALVGDAGGDYLFSARVTVEFGADFDAGVLMLHAGDDLWAKLCFEYSPQGQPMIVSVVTRGRSDDANSYDVAGNSTWLRIARLGDAFAFHASPDGETWNLIRMFTLGADVEPAVGFEVQSPTGDGCRATFDDIRWRAARLEHLRDGS
jgi:uncharacterized protein